MDHGEDNAEPRAQRTDSHNTAAVCAHRTGHGHYFLRACPCYRGSLDQGEKHTKRLDGLSHRSPFFPSSRTQYEIRCRLSRKTRQPEKPSTSTWTRVRRFVTESDSFWSNESDFIGDEMIGNSLPQSTVDGLPSAHEWADKTVEIHYCIDA